MGEDANKRRRDPQPDEGEPGDLWPQPIDCPAGQEHGWQSTSTDEDERYTQLGVIERRLFAKRRKKSTPRAPKYAERSEAQIGHSREVRHAHNDAIPQIESPYSIDSARPGNQRLKHRHNVRKRNGQCDGADRWNRG
jgi:hypothetical protein